MQTPAEYGARLAGEARPLTDEQVERAARVWATEPPMFLDVRAAARLTTLSADSIKRAIHAGHLRAKRTGGRGGKYLVGRRALEAWFESLPDA